MSQLPSGMRRSSGGDLDVYTGLALAGCFALIIAVVFLWMEGTKLASDGSQSNLPFHILDR